MSKPRSSTCLPWAAQSGELEVLMWAVMHGCPRNWDQCSQFASDCKHEEVEDWMEKQISLHGPLWLPTHRRRGSDSELQRLDDAHMWRRRRNGRNH